MNQSATTVRWVAPQYADKEKIRKYADLTLVRCLSSVYTLQLLFDYVSYILVKARKDRLGISQSGYLANTGAGGRGYTGGRIFETAAVRSTVRTIPVCSQLYFY